MKAFSKKRLWLVGGAVTSVGAAAALLAGATFGFFSSAGTASGSNTFTAGNVVVGLGGGTQVTCAIGPMSPGDDQTKAGNVACKYSITYTGNVNAYLALDLAITGAPGTPQPTYGSGTPSPAQGLYDGTSNGLQFNISDASATYMSGVQFLTSGATPTTLTPTSGAISVKDLLVTASPIASGVSKTVTVNYNLPTTAGNAYNLATSTIVLTVHAVQADNNALPIGCTTAGRQCDTLADHMTWS